MKRLLLVAWFAVPAFAYTSATQVVVPTYAGGIAGAMSGSANQMRCAVFIMPFSITGATKLTFGVQTAAGTCAVGLYPDADGGTLLLGGNVSCASTGAKVITSASQNLTAGTPYRLCMCSTSTTTATTTVEAAATAGRNLADILNAGATRLGTGTACSSGVLNSTTGSLTPAIFKAPIAVIE